MLPADLGLRDPSLLVDRCLVGDRWLSVAEAGAAITVRNPANGSVVAEVPALGVTHVRHAIAVASEAQRAWAGRPARERSLVLKRWFDLIVANHDDLARILTAEQGKPLAEARAEIMSNAEYIEWFAEEAKRIDGAVIQSAAAGQRIVVLKQPVGVCAAITPWNFPNGMITRKVGPALAAGCAIVLKPAEQTPLSAFALAVLAERAGLPAGLLSVITGDAEPIGREFCHNPTVRKISFTGSTRVGRWLMREASDDITRLSLELGGNAAFIIFDDADVDAAVDGAIAAKFRNAGQTCVCANRIFVQDGIRDIFVERFVARVGALRQGSGETGDVDIGPLIDERAVAKVTAHIADAVAAGASVVLGGRRSVLGGTFFEPTVMVGVRPGMLVMAEETFAPLAPIIGFRSEDEVISMANDTEFGLAGYFYSRDLSRAWRVAERLECGMVGVNAVTLANAAAPFGGIKQSGEGREGSRYGIDAFLNLKYVLFGGL